MSVFERFICGLLAAAVLSIAAWYGVCRYGIEQRQAGYDAAVADGKEYRDLEAQIARQTEDELRAQLRTRDDEAHRRNRNMLNRWKMLSAVCALALTACAAQPRGQYQAARRPKIDPLPAELQLTEQDRSLCRRLLLTFSATEQQLQDSCGDTSASSNGLKPAAR